MTLYQKAKTVERLFQQLDKDIKKYSAESKLHCLLGCGRCCTKPDIDATVLEFLPLAMQYYLEGRAEEMLEKLRKGDAICHVFSLTNETMGSGFCSNYSYRGMVCRLFGFSARRGKNDLLQLYTCKLMKEDQAEEFARVSGLINNTKRVPVVSNYYQRLRNIDEELGSKFYPINEAVARAIEEILHYYA